MSRLISQNNGSRGNTAKTAAKPQAGAGSPARRAWWGLLLGPVLAAVGLAACLAWGANWDMDGFRLTVRRLAPGTIAALCLLHLAQQFTRTLRLAVLLPRHVPLTRLAAVVLLHQFFAAMLPLKTGSLSMPEMLKRLGIARSRTLATMFTYAGMELWVTVVLIGGTAWLLRPHAGETRQLQDALLVMGVCLLGGALVVFRGARRFDRWLEEASRGFSWSGCQSWLARGRVFFQTLAELPAGRAAEGLAFTLLNTAIAVSFSFVFCRQLAPELSWQSLLLIILLMRVVGQFALQGLAGLGTSEPIMVLLFCAFGLTVTQAVAVTVLGRAFYLALLVAGAAVGGMLWWVPRSAACGEGSG